MKYFNFLNNGCQISRKNSQFCNGRLSLLLALICFYFVHICQAASLDDSSNIKMLKHKYKPLENKFNPSYAKEPSEYAIEQEKPLFIEKCHIIPKPEQVCHKHFLKRF